MDSSVRVCVRPFGKFTWILFEPNSLMYICFVYRSRHMNVCTKPLKHKIIINQRLVCLDTMFILYMKYKILHASIKHSSNLKFEGKRTFVQLGARSKVQRLIAK